MPLYYGQFTYINIASFPVVAILKILFRLLPTFQDLTAGVTTLTCQKEFTYANQAIKTSEVRLTVSAFKSLAAVFF